MLVNFALSTLWREGYIEDMSFIDAMMRPPEYYANGDGLGQASDLWAVGVLLYRLVTGEYPFSGTVDEVKEKVKNCDWRLPEKKDPVNGVYLSRGLVDLLKRLLTADIEERFTAAQVLC